jgi:hypothetical protein
MAKALAVKSGVLFSWREQLSPRITGGETAIFERLMHDGTFASPSEQLEWVPRGHILVYRVGGVLHCPDIAKFASGNKRECLPI